MSRSLLRALILLSLIAGVQAANIYTPIVQMPPTTGHAYVTIRCMSNCFNYNMVLTSFSENQAENIAAMPDGRWDRELLPGDYVLILMNGNGEQREYRYFTIQAGETTYIDQFIGHAISGKRGNVTSVPTIDPTQLPTISPATTPTSIPTTSPALSPTITVMPTPVPITPVPITPRPTPTPAMCCYQRTDFGRWIFIHYGSCPYIHWKQIADECGDGEP